MSPWLLIFLASFTPSTSTSSQGNIMGKMELLSGSAKQCSFLSIPQASCYSITACMERFQEEYQGDTTYVLISTNSQPCCPNIVGQASSDGFYAQQNGGNKWGISKIVLVTSTQTTLDMTITDDAGHDCHLMYLVIEGTILGATSFRNVRNPYGVYYAFVWVPIMLLFLCITCLCLIPWRSRRRPAIPNGVIFKPPPAATATATATATMQQPPIVIAQPVVTAQPVVMAQPVTEGSQPTINSTNAREMQAIEQV